MKRNPTTSTTSTAWHPGLPGLLTAIFLSATLPLPAVLSDLESVWHCDNSLNESNGGTALSASGFTPAYASDTIAGSSATVLDLPALAPAQSLGLPNGTGANGGGTRTNNWTIVMDLKIGALGADAALLQTDASNATDAPVRVSSTGVLTFGSTPVSEAGAIQAGVWHRLALTSEVVGGALVCKAYLDGVQTTVGGTAATATGPLDGSFSLGSAVLLFSDDNSGTRPLRLNDLAFWGTTLGGAELTALGGPSAAGVPDVFVSNNTSTSSGSLRKAIFSVPSGGTVSFDLSLDGQTIILDADGRLLVSGKTLRIEALHLSGGLTVDGNSQYHVFVVESGADLTLAGLTLARGKANDTGDNSGGAILNEGTLSMKWCTIRDSSATGTGGGLTNIGTATLEACTVSNNQAPGHGGIQNIGTITLVNCTLAHNTATGGVGGGLGNGGTATLRNCTISANHAAGGGGGIFYESFFASSFTLENCIVADNTSDVPGEDNISINGFGTITELGTNLTSGDPLLAPLGNFGGFTRTMPFLAGSPASDTAIPTSNSPAEDQRGEPRDPDTPDIGAVEIDGPGFSSPFDFWAASNILAGQDATFTGDSEGDRAINGLEYAFRLNPQVDDFLDLPMAASFAGPGGGRALRIVIPFEPTATDIVYILEESHDLRAFTEIYSYAPATGTELVNRAGLTNTLDPEAKTITVTEDTPGPLPTFWRVGILRNSSPQ